MTTRILLQSVFLSSSLVATMIALASPAALACSCLPPDSIEAHLADVEVAFVGKQKRTKRSWFSGPYEPAVTTFEVLTAYKGVDSEARVKVTHMLDGSLCGVRFAKREVILVLAGREEDGTLATGLCTMIPAQIDPEGYREALEAGLEDAG